MSKVADNYGKVLFQLNMPEDAVLDAKELLLEEPLLLEALANPAVTKEEKRRVIDRLFHPVLGSFLKAFCDSGHVEEFLQVFAACERCRMEAKGRIGAVLLYAREPEKKQIEAIKEKIAKKYNKDSVRLDKIQDDSLIGGFILRVGDDEYDYSIKGRLDRIHKTLAGR